MGWAGVLLLLLLSGACLALAPLVLPESYSWTSQTTSEAAAQGVKGAWLARSGFLAFGFAVLWLSTLSRERWGAAASSLLGAFGVLMIATAAFSHRPWDADAPYDELEDALHSFTATAMGFAFALGVAAVAVTIRHRTTGRRALDVMAVAASVGIPVSMSFWPGGDGLLQRAMFLAAYVWFGVEALSLRASPTAPD